MQRIGLPYLRCIWGRGRSCLSSRRTATSVKPCMINHTDPEGDSFPQMGSTNLVFISLVLVQNDAGRWIMHGMIKRLTTTVLGSTEQGYRLCDIYILLFTEALYQQPLHCFTNSLKTE